MSQRIRMCSLPEGLRLSMPLVFVFTKIMIQAQIAKRGKKRVREGDSSEVPKAHPNMVSQSKTKGRAQHIQPTLSEQPKTLRLRPDPTRALQQ